MSEQTDLPPTPTPPRPRGFDTLWDPLRRSGLRRPLDDRWIGGVCSGVARRLGVDPVLIRAGLAATVLLGGVGILLYAVALVLLPDHDGRIELERASYGDLTGTTVGAVALLLLAVVLPSPWALLGGGDLVSGRELVGALVVGTLLLVGLALLPQLREAVERSSARSAAAGATGAASPAQGPAAPYGGSTADDSTAWYGGTGTGDSTAWYGGSTAYGSTTGATAPGRPEDAWARYAWSPSGSTAYGRPAVPPRAPRPPRPVRGARRGPGPALSAAATGGALVAAGAAWIATRVDLLPGRPAIVAACAALLVLGAVLVGLGVAGRRDGGVGGTTFLVLLAVVALLLVPSWRTTQLAGERTWAPSDVAEAGRGGSIGLGDGYLDLSGLADLPDGAGVDVPVRVGIGEMTVLVPEGMDVRVETGALVGSVMVGEGDDVSTETGGVGVSRRLVDAADPQVVVDARALVGTVRVLEVEEP